VDRIDETEKKVLEIDNRGTKAGKAQADNLNATVNAFNTKYEVFAMEIRTKLANIEAILQELKSR